MTRIHVEESLRARVAAFLDTHGVSWEVADEGTGDLRVVCGPAEPRAKCSVDCLVENGWIPCATAWSLAKKHGIAIGKLGALIDALNIKVRQCSLGCFK
ncbi:MAG TPA: hypothetical protein PLO37_13555 [Candidatus Hydrogenedentes bacterium]|nr:hypothetical protein [Candidatus Hydrogenedentota bacterium]HPG67870.1 hypothetical protein [Candidatus Hydrogenedentota bacterium]